MVRHPATAVPLVVPLPLVSLAWCGFYERGEVECINTISESKFYITSIEVITVLQANEGQSFLNHCTTYVCTCMYNQHIFFAISKGVLWIIPNESCRLLLAGALFLASSARTISYETSMCYWRLISPNPEPAFYFCTRLFLEEGSRTEMNCRNRTFVYVTDQKVIPAAGPQPILTWATVQRSTLTERCACHRRSKKQVPYVIVERMTFSNVTFFSQKG